MGKRFWPAAMVAVGALIGMSCEPAPVEAADYPTPKDGSFVARNVKFHTGETLGEVNLSYKTIGEPGGEPVLILHGTAGSAQSMLTPGFAGELFGPGQPLDAKTHFIIIPDALGAGKSSKPSDGMKAQFPRYNYDDMVDAQYRLVTEGLGIRHLRLILGNSMGGMHSWVWGTRYPGMMDAIVPMASQPTAMSSRNWMMRRLMIETIKADPDYKDGNYTTQPKMLRIANVFYGTGTNGGDLAYQSLAPTREAADKLVEARLAEPAPADANDFIWQWASSSDYDVSSKLGAITAHVLAINSADDERNPVATGLMDSAMKQVKNGTLYVIPASTETRGHGTTGSFARLWAPQLAAFLPRVPKR
jgi:homoserine O-acetyltransferase